MNRFPVLGLLLLLLTISTTVSAQAPDSEEGPERPLVHVDVELRMEAIERSAAEVSVAVGEMATAMRQIAATGELSVAQQAHLESIMANLDHVVAASRESVDALPGVVSRSREAVRAGAGEWLAELKFWFFVVIAVVAVLLVFALAAFYWFTLRPLQNTVLQAVGHISAMAQGMANTAKSLEIINETHREVLRLSGLPGGGSKAASKPGSAEGSAPTPAPPGSDPS